MNLLKFIFLVILFPTLLFTTGCNSIKKLFRNNDNTTYPEILAPNRPYSTDSRMDKIKDEDSTVYGNKDGELPVRSNEWVVLDNSGFPVIYFAYNQYRIGTSEKPKLETVANYLIKNSTLGLQIEGHCDERGSEEYNRSLGERRAISVKNYLTTLGVSENRLRTTSYGEEKPAVTGVTPSNYAKNRRAELAPARLPKR